MRLTAPISPRWSAAHLCWLSAMLCASWVTATEPLPPQGHDNARNGLPRFDGVEESLKLFEPPRPKPPLQWDGVVQPEQNERMRRFQQQRQAAQPVQRPAQIIPVPAVDQQAFQRRRIIMLPGQGVRMVVTSGVRGRDAWMSSILRTTKIEVARQQAEEELDQFLVHFSEHHQLDQSQCDKLRLAGLGDINRFLSACESFVNDVTAYESRPSELDDGILRDYWERSNQLRDQLSRGLHGPSSLLHKQWERQRSSAERPTRSVKEQDLSPPPTAVGT